MRPQSITIVCIILTVVGVSLAARSIGQFVILPGFYSLLMLVISLLGLYSYYGLWKMKRWCIPLFYIVWGFISASLVFGTEEFSRVVIMRSLYLVAVILIFTVIVLPYRHSMTKGSIWKFK